jgi:tetratricopeptide (TPR) repeat protein
MSKNLLVLLFAIVFAAGCTKSARLARHLERADAAWQKGDFETARLEYLNALKLDANQPQVFSRLGLAMFERGEIAPAAQLLLRAKELQPTNVPVRLKLGAIFISMGRLTNAIEEAEAVLAQSPGNGEAAALLASATAPAQLSSLEQRLQRLAIAHPREAQLHLALGIVQTRTGKSAAAESSFSTARTLDPKSSKPALALGNLYLAQNKTNEARALLKSASELAPARSVERLRFAEFQLRHGDPQDGKKILEDTVAAAPDFTLARASLAEVYLLERRTNECSVQIEGLLKTDPRNSTALLLRSRLKQLLGDPAGAIEDVETITRSDNSNPAAFYELAQLYRARNEPSRALAAVDRALAIRTNFLQAIVLKSELLIGSGEYAAAIPPLIQLTNQVPNLPAPYFLLASAFRGRGTPDDALALYSRMSRVFPGDPQPHHYAAITLRQQKRYAEARQAYTRALQVQTNFLPAIDDLIELDINATNYTAALNRVQTYIDLYPDKPMPRVLQAKVFAAEKKYSDAEASLKKAIELAPDFYLGHRSLANLYIASGQTPQAMEKLKNLIGTNPKDTGSMLQLGMMYEAEKKYADARGIYEKLLQVQPNAFYVLNNLAYLLSEHFHDNDAAWTLAQKARSLNANDPFLADTYGWIAFRRSDYARALPILQYAADRLPDKPEVSFHLGMAYYMSGQMEPAAAALAMATSSSAEFPGKDDAKAALAVLQVDPAKPKPDDKRIIDAALARNRSDVFALIRLAQIQQQQKEWAKAGVTYEAALKASPKSATILLQLGALKAEQLNRTSEALAHAREAWALAQDPATAAAVGRIGVLAGDPKWALPILQLAVRNSAAGPSVYFYHALAAYSQADFQSAAESLEHVRTLTAAFPEKSKAADFLVIVKLHQASAPLERGATAAGALLKADRQFPPALIANGLVLESQGKFMDARQNYETVLQAAPDHLLAQRQLALLLCDKLADDKAAGSIATRVRAQAPDDPIALQVLGKIAFRRGDYREAASLLSSAAARLSQNADVLYHLGLAEYHLKQKNARKSLNDALALDPGAKLAADARKALAELN